MSKAHQNGNAPMGDGRDPFSQDTKEHLEKLIETDIGEKYLRHMKSEFSKENVLANRKEPEVWEYKYTIKNRTKQFIRSFPREESKLSGEFRQLFGFDDAKEPLTDEERREIWAIADALFARVTRSRGGWQQEIWNERVQVRRLEDERNGRAGRDNRRPESEKGGGSSVVKRLLR